MTLNNLSLTWQQVVLIGFAYIYGTFLCGFFIRCIVIKLRVNTPLNFNHYIEYDPNEDDNLFSSNQSLILGFIERALYILAIYFFPGLIAAWLGLKTVSIWKKWSDINGRILFNVFLIGNGLSVFSAFVAYLMIRVSMDLPSDKIPLPYFLIFIFSTIFLYFMFYLSKHIKEK